MVISNIQHPFFVFATNLNGVEGETGIINVITSKLLCLCTEENSKIILQALNRDFLTPVMEFHERFEHPILPVPTIPGAGRCILRMSLLNEELIELQHAIDTKNIVEVADAFCDLQYVLSGAILEFGMKDKFPLLYAEVHRSNMSKACTTIEEAEATVKFYLEKQDKDKAESYIEERGGVFFVYRKSDKKTLKSINYSPANLKKILI